MFSKSLVFWLTLVATASLQAADGPVSGSGIPLDTPWKVAIHEFSVQNLKHSSWGLAHSERNYHVALRLATAEGWSLDSDSLFAAAFLHDVGGMPAFEVAGIDHAVRSVEVAEERLATWGFPQESWPQARDMILGHVYYGPEPESLAARAFRDADVLDFLGALGAARLVAATGELDRSPTLATPFAVIEQFANDLPGKLSSTTARDEAPALVEEMRAFAAAVRARTFDGRAF